MTDLTPDAIMEQFQEDLDLWNEEDVDLLSEED